MVLHRPVELAPHIGHFSGVAVEVPALLSCNSIRKVQLSAEHIAIGGMGASSQATRRD